MDSRRCPSPNAVAGGSKSSRPRHGQARRRAACRRTSHPRAHSPRGGGGPANASPGRAHSRHHRAAHIRLLVRDLIARLGGVCVAGDAGAGAVGVAAPRGESRPAMAVQPLPVGGPGGRACAVRRLGVRMYVAPAGDYLLHTGGHLHGRGVVAPAGRHRHHEIRASAARARNYRGRDHVHPPVDRQDPSALFASAGLAKARRGSGTSRRRQPRRHRGHRHHRAADQSGHIRRQHQDRARIRWYRWCGHRFRRPRSDQQLLLRIYDLSDAALLHRVVSDAGAHLGQAAAVHSQLQVLHADRGEPVAHDQPPHQEDAALAHRRPAGGQTDCRRRASHAVGACGLGPETAPHGVYRGLHRFQLHTVD
eukprot:ctg_580.g165